MKTLSTLTLMLMAVAGFSPVALADSLDLQARPGFGHGPGPGRGGDNWGRPDDYYRPGRPGRPGYPGRPGHPGRPGRPDRPGRPVPPPRHANLCEGTFLGGYSNGASAVISIYRQWGEQISVNIQLNGREHYTAQGSCREWGNQAQFIFTLNGHGIVHRGNISQDYSGRIVMQGAQDGGFAFQATR